MFSKKNINVNDKEKLLDRVKNFHKDSPSAESNIIDGGLNNSRKTEPVPQFIKAEGEKVISNGNSWIVLGRDRPTTRVSGKGGNGESGCSMIDIVVGRRPLDSNIWVDPNFKTDSARFYIAERTDIDVNFQLTEGKTGIKKDKSAIGMKADDIRIIGRESVKIVTGPFSQEKDTLGAKQNSVFGIELIAGNDSTDLQPMLKGTDTVEALKKIYSHLDDLAGVLETFMNNQTKINNAVFSHTHVGSVGNLGAPLGIIPDPILLGSGNAFNSIIQINASSPLTSNRTNMNLSKVNSLESYGKNYICSRYNKVN